MHGLHQVRARAPSDPIIPKADSRPKEALVAAASCALAALVLALPVFSPDAWWHLSAGRWIWAHGAIPRADPFSFARLGAPWVDFEWGFQALLFPFSRLGDAGLWLAKGLLLLGAWLPVDGLLRDRGARGAARAFGAALWACAMLPKADLRPDLVSAALFAWQLRRLASGRASFLFGWALFAVWANLHAGFALGLILYPAWALALRAARRNAPEALWAELSGAALGALLNPWGLGLAAAFSAHAGTPLRDAIAEWGAFTLAWRFHWPAAGVMALGAWGAWRARRREPALAAASAVLLAASLVSARFTAYWPAAGVALAAEAVPAPAALAALALLLGASLRTVRLGSAYADVYVDRPAADWVASEPALAGLRLFNTYEWGGYLGWRLGPGGRVFGDGRYLFERQIADLRDALSAPERMAAFADRERLDGFLITDFLARFPGTRVHADGTRRELTRPWHLSFFPRERWALVWWDRRALVLVDRRKAPAAWLAAREYRWWRPGDDEALADARERGEVPESALASERARWSAEHPELAGR